MWRSADLLKKGQFLLLAAGICLHLVTALFLGSGEYLLFRAGLFAWSITPYLLLVAALRRKMEGTAVFLGALAALMVDANTFWSVFLKPANSTASLNLLAAPFWNLFCFVPVAMVFGYFLAKAFRARK